MYVQAKAKPDPSAPEGVTRYWFSSTEYDSDLIVWYKDSDNFSNIQNLTGFEIRYNYKGIFCEKLQSERYRVYMLDEFTPVEFKKLKEIFEKEMSGLDLVLAEFVKQQLDRL